MKKLILNRINAEVTNLEKKIIIKEPGGIIGAPDIILQILPKSKIDFSKGSEVMIDYYSRLLSLIDFYDAVSHRKNDKFEEGKRKKVVADEKKQIFISNNKDLEYMILNLYEAKIFT